MWRPAVPGMEDFFGRQPPLVEFMVPLEKVCALSGLGLSDWREGGRGGREGGREGMGRREGGREGGERGREGERARLVKIAIRGNLLMQLLIRLNTLGPLTRAVMVPQPISDSIEQLVRII